MQDTSPIGNDFLAQTEALLLEHLSDAQFGVSELAEAMHMSRSSLLRKIKKHTELSASQYVSQFRLKKGMELLRQGSQTVSEVAHQVGFGSTSYFIKCFREQYGYPPGEVGKTGPLSTATTEENTTDTPSVKRPAWPMALALLLLLSVVVYLLVDKAPATTDGPGDKSIAVLPFKNESSDSTNLYFVNGLMESTLSNLQKIEALRVVSRTSSERYRNTDKGIREIAQALNVSYLVEGSGQRVGDQVLLNIQLIDAATDQPLWSAQYNNEVLDIFDLQTEVASKIANAIEAVVTPAELKQIEKQPTENLVAYDYFLQALDPYFTRTTEGLQTAIPLFEKAIEEDPQFALAYADLAITYYFLDEYQAEKQYTELINNYADKALLYDSKLTESLIAKALYYKLNKEYRLALPHLEKALEYNPNSSAVVQMLSDLYANYLPNTAKYLEYALKGVQLEIAPGDSIAKSYLYLHLSNAFFQNGFVEEAISHVNQSLSLFQNNYYAPYARVYMLHGRDQDLEETKSRFVELWKKDSSRLEFLQEIAKINYYLGNYDEAFLYYEKFAEAREKYNLDIFSQEDAKIGLMYEKQGLKEKANAFYDSYARFCASDQSIYSGASHSVLYAQQGKTDQAIEQLRRFAAQDHYQYLVVLFIEMEPLYNSIKSHPEYRPLIQTIKDRFWQNQAKLRQSLEEKGLM